MVKLLYTGNSLMTYFAVSTKDTSVTDRQHYRSYTALCNSVAR